MVIFRSCADNLMGGYGLCRPPTQNFGGDRPPLSLPWITPVLRGEGLVWLLAAPWVQLSVSAGTGWPHNALRHHWLMPISCYFRDCKALLVTSLTRVSGAIASVQTFTFTRSIVRPLRDSRASCSPSGRYNSVPNVISIITTVTETPLSGVSNQGWVRTNRDFKQ